VKWSYMNEHFVKRKSAVCGLSGLGGKAVSDVSGALAILLMSWVISFMRETHSQRDEYDDVATARGKLDRRGRTTSLVLYETLRE
jgi:hypothetical protein